MLALLVACGGEAAPELRCELTPGGTIASADGARFDAIALDARGSEALAVWSAAAGLFARELDALGKPRSGERRLGERCRGGVDVALTAEGALVACMRPDENEEEASSLVVYALDAELGIRREHTLGPVGRDGRGVDIAVDAQRTFLLHHDGTVGDHEVRFSSLEAEPRLQKATLSRPGRSPSQPALHFEPRADYATFTETDYATPGKTVTDVMVTLVSDFASGKQQLPWRVQVDDPAPHLVRDARGLVLTFRDQPAAERRPHFYALRLSDQLTPQGKPVKIGRANTEGVPALHVCGGARLGILPREYGGERYIALHALGPDLENLGKGHQFFANGRDYVLAAGACVGDELLALIGEQKTLADRGVELLSLRFGCE